MALSVEQRQEIIKSQAKHDNDSGSAAVQVAVITSRLQYLQEHFSKHKKDFHSRRGLLKLVGRRRRLLDYMKKKNIQEYRALIEKLGIRK